MLRVAYAELFETLLRVLLKLGFEPKRARLCDRLFADTDRDGVYTHGLNRFPRFQSMIEVGWSTFTPNRSCSSVQHRSSAGTERSVPGISTPITARKGQSHFPVNMGWGA
jgi:LDH2 family malate/lactate/ureidoglycolate dehydrogenase